MGAKTNHKFTWATVLLALVAVCAPRSRAMQYHWTGAGANSVWSNPGNWSNEPQDATAPVSPGDEAVIDVPDTPTSVVFDQNVVNDSVELQNGELTLDLSGNNYTLTNMVRVCPGDGQTGTLRVTGGTLGIQLPVSGGYNAVLGAGANSRTTVIVEGEGAKIAANTGFYMSQGTGSYGEFIFSEGAVFETDSTMRTYNGRLVFSNATFTALKSSGMRFGNGTGSESEVVFIGLDCAAGGNLSSWYLGYGTRSRASMYVGPEVSLTPGSFYPYIGSGVDSTGVITMVGSTIASVSGGAVAMSLTLGHNARVDIGTAPASGSGQGTLNLLDGSLLRGTAAVRGRLLMCI